VTNMEPKVRRVVTKFLHACDDRAGEMDVTHIPYGELCRIVQPSHSDPLMYDSYRLGSAELHALQSSLPEVIDTGQYDYYLETEGE
jgi:hypothetical protein